MKKLILSILILIFSTIFFSCETEAIEYTEDSIKTSWVVSIENISVTSADFLFTVNNETNRNLVAHIKFSNEGTVFQEEEISIPENNSTSGDITIIEQSQLSEITYQIFIRNEKIKEGLFTTLGVEYINVGTFNFSGSAVPINLTNDLNGVPFAQQRFECNGPFKLSEFIFEYKLTPGNITHPSELFEKITTNRQEEFIVGDYSLWEEISPGVFRIHLGNLNIEYEEGIHQELFYVSTKNYERTDTFAYKLKIIGKDTKNQFFGENSEEILIIM